MEEDGNNNYDNLTEYEKQRIAHVARNKAYMKRLGIHDLAMTVRIGGGEKKKQKQNNNNNNNRTKKNKMKKAPERFSSRIRNKPAENDGSFVDNLNDNCVTTIRKETIKQQQRQQKRTTTHEEMLETSVCWLENARMILLKRTNKTESITTGRTTTTTNDHWRDEAVARWGECVPALASVVNWEAFVKSRLGTPPPPSDMQLLQEYYAHDGWQLLVACILMSRVSSAAVKHRCISGFFEKFPTPSSFHTNAKPDEVFEIISSLGLFPNRMRSLVEVTTRFLTCAGRFEVGLDPETKIYGIGVFGMDSYLIFCRGDLSHEADDKNVQAFVNWQRKREKEERCTNNNNNNDDNNNNSKKVKIEEVEA